MSLKEPSKAVQALLAKSGGLLPLNGDDLVWLDPFRFYNNEIIQSIAAARRHVNGAGIDLEFVFFKSTRFNARCYKVDDQYAIGLSSNVIPMLLQAVKNLTDNGAGLIKRNKFAPVAIEQISTDRLLLSETIYEYDSKSFQDQLAVNCVLIALDIIVSHELTHILNGHLDYRLDIYGINHIDESEDLKSSDDSLTDRTLEWDADAACVQRTLLRALEVKLPFPNGLNHHSIFQPPPYGLHGTLANTLYNFAIAMQCVLKFFEDERKNSGVQKNYPSIEYRRDMYARHVIQTLMDRIDPRIKTEEKLRNFYLSGYVQGMLDFKEYSRLDNNESWYDPIDFLYRDTQALVDETKTYEKKWEEIYPAIRQHRILATPWDTF